MASLTLAEQFTLRALTGRVVGEAIANAIGVRGTLGILTNKTYICASLTGAIEAAYVAHYGGTRRVVTTMAESEEQVKSALEGLAGSSLVFTAFGGEAGADVNLPLTRAFLRALKDSSCKADVFFHVRIWAPGFVKKALEEDPSLAEGLKNRNVYTFTFDLDKGVFFFNRVVLGADNSLTLEKIAEVPIGVEHKELLQKSL
ncbi:MAG: hypothetical protein BLITH_1515 [Brockia lithotrophica]|uniref:Uncharacterized protein n=1 Tax=Brockia lithotrophica TaxID=933949 RepID=A0A2T5G5J6_9BACL|nr:MAG: hypothetical protein BLITH_1515 [Brockia lithotrophica]